MPKPEHFRTLEFSGVLYAYRCFRCTHFNLDANSGYGYPNNEVVYPTCNLHNFTFPELVAISTVCDDFAFMKYEDKLCDLNIPKKTEDPLSDVREDLKKLQEDVLKLKSVKTEEEIKDEEDQILGEHIIELLGLKMVRGTVKTSFGIKSPKGLCRTMRRLLEGGY